MGRLHEHRPERAVCAAVGDREMRPTYLVQVLGPDDNAAERRRDEEFRAWHRQPDATPLPARRSNRLLGRLAIVAMVARTTLLGTLGRAG
jgi:hypothetical protein